MRMIDVTPHVSYVFSAPPHHLAHKNIFSVFSRSQHIGNPYPFFLLDTSNSIRRGLSGASTAGRPRRPASGPDGVGGVIAKPNVMCRGEVGLEDREDESVENGKCFHGVGDIFISNVWKHEW